MGSFKIVYSFEQWCKDNNHQDYLDLWDYELNDKKPNEVSYGSSKKCWFKCNKGLHQSELTKILSSTSAQNSPIRCTRCNSFGQYLLDTYGNLDIWSPINLEDPFNITKKSDKRISLICPICNNIKNTTPRNHVYYGFGCVCSDGVSYPNKFITSLIMQLEIEFNCEMVFEWSQNKRYDHYIPSINCIIENNGIQHYTGWHNDIHDLHRQLENDALKEKLAQDNGIENYIVLNCSKSDKIWMKNNIMDSRLPEILGFKEMEIDWDECEKFTTSNRVKEACDIWNSGKINNTLDLAKYMGVDRSTVGRYLNKGNEYRWCNYNGKEEMRKVSVPFRKQVEVLKDGVSYGVFEGVRYLSRQSKKLFGIFLDQGAIGRVCRGEKESYKGYIFRYVN